MTVHGADVGRWLARQRETWAGLSDAQRERLTALGVSAPAPAPAAAERRHGNTASQQRAPTSPARAP
ncbi:helicase associated domain-containing protein [Streptomyces sp. NPDC045431]|uniref:helicase associated domain-containing protein n=1 Tax=Streptomyces sp. NPDC045431 TaxID=3155613 RepID=UPI0034035A6F